jgi:hypothetical protein
MASNGWSVHLLRPEVISALAPAAASAFVGWDLEQAFIRIASMHGAWVGGGDGGFVSVCSVCRHAGQTIAPELWEPEGADASLLHSVASIHGPCRTCLFLSVWRCGKQAVAPSINQREWYKRTPAASIGDKTADVQRLRADYPDVWHARSGHFFSCSRRVACCIRGEKFSVNGWMGASLCPECQATNSLSLVVG